MNVMKLNGIICRTKIRYLVSVITEFKAKCFDRNVECNILANLSYVQCEGLRGIPIRESEGISSDLLVKVFQICLFHLKIQKQIFLPNTASLQ